jgi:hypothetical protein
MHEMLTVFTILHGCGHCADSFYYFLNNTIFFLLNLIFLLNSEYKVLEFHELFHLIIITRLGKVIISQLSVVADNWCNKFAATVFTLQFLKRYFWLIRKIKLLSIKFDYCLIFFQLLIEGSNLIILAIDRLEISCKLFA